MQLEIFSVRDSAALAFGRPFFSPSRGVALRSFGDEINRVAPDNLMAAHPGDYDLYYLGVFDDSDGSILAANPAPERVCRGVDLVKGS